MNIRRLPIIILMLTALACNAVTQVLNPATPTPEPTATATKQPVYVPPDCANIALATLPAATELAQPTQGVGINPTISTTVQLRVLDRMVATVKKVYVYPDYNGTDWPTLAADFRKKVQAGMDTEAFYTGMEVLVSALNDEHSGFQSPLLVKQSDEELAGSNNFVGIGVLVLPLPEKGRMTILTVFPDSPAAHAGLKPHDSILAVDGLSIVKDGEAQPQMVRGPQCSGEVLTVQSPGGEPRPVTLYRHKITASEPIIAQLVATTDGSHIGYIFLPSFFDETIPGQVKQALEDFGPLDGLILDNRMNGGGSSDVVEPIFSYFTSGMLGHFVSRTGNRPLTIDAHPVQNSDTVPMVVLVGKDTVSFGEIFSGAMQDTGRAKLVGETTLGNVEILHGYDFEDKSLLWVAEERFDPAVSHANWEKTGIIPDVQADADWDTFTFENDPSVAAAVTLLGHK